MNGCVQGGGGMCVSVQGGGMCVGECAGRRDVCGHVWGGEMCLSDTCADTIAAHLVMRVCVYVHPRACSKLIGCIFMYNTVQCLYAYLHDHDAPVCSLLYT